MAAEIEVLVVDEDAEVLELTETFLDRESDRITVTTETDPHDALEVLVDGAFDCVVSDYQMPKLDGIELFEAIREERPTLPFFLLTATADEDFDERAESAAVTGYVRKGVGSDHYTELADAIETAFE
jgi:CheY-like chemotaxis protein